MKHIVKHGREDERGECGGHGTHNIEQIPEVGHHRGHEHREHHQQCAGHNTSSELRLARHARDLQGGLQRQTYRVQGQRVPLKKKKKKLVFALVEALSVSRDVETNLLDTCR